MQHLFMGGGACALPLTAGWRMCATPIQVMGGQGDWLDESRGPCPLTPLDSPSSTRGPHRRGAVSWSVRGCQRALKMSKTCFSAIYTGKIVSSGRASPQPNQAKRGGSGRSSGKRPSARGPPGPPSGQQGGLARTRQLAKLALISSLRRLRQEGITQLLDCAPL